MPVDRHLLVRGISTSGRSCRRASGLDCLALASLTSTPSPPLCGSRDGGERGLMSCGGAVLRDIDGGTLARCCSGVSPRRPGPPPGAAQGDRLPLTPAPVGAGVGSGEATTTVPPACRAPTAALVHQDRKQAKNSGIAARINAPNRTSARRGRGGPPPSAIIKRIRMARSPAVSPVDDQETHDSSQSPEQEACSAQRDQYRVERHAGSAAPTGRARPRAHHDRHHVDDRPSIAKAIKRVTSPW